jgi:hypothetical protein
MRGRRLAPSEITEKFTGTDNMQELKGVSRQILTQVPIASTYDDRNRLAQRRGVTGIQDEYRYNDCGFKKFTEFTEDRLNIPKVPPCENCSRAQYPVAAEKKSATATVFPVSLTGNSSSEMRGGNTL